MTYEWSRFGLDQILELFGGLEPQLLDEWGA